jgi:hypothetical protein
MFTELLCLVAGGTVFINAFMEGRKGGALGTLIGTLIGLGAGFGVFWTMRKATKWTVIRYQLYEAKLSTARLALSWGLVIVILICILLPGIAVAWLIRLIVDHL